MSKKGQSKFRSSWSSSVRGQHRVTTLDLKGCRFTYAEIDACLKESASRYCIQHYSFVRRLEITVKGSASATFIVKAAHIPSLVKRLRMFIATCEEGLVDQFMCSSQGGISFFTRMSDNDDGDLPRKAAQYTYYARLENLSQERFLFGGGRDTFLIRTEAFLNKAQCFALARFMEKVIKTVTKKEVKG